MALVLNIEIGEIVRIGNVYVRCEAVIFHGNSLRISIEAPKDVLIERLDKNLELKRLKKKGPP